MKILRLVFMLLCIMFCFSMVVELNKQREENLVENNTTINNNTTFHHETSENITTDIVDEHELHGLCLTNIGANLNTIYDSESLDGSANINEDISNCYFYSSFGNRTIDDYYFKVKGDYLILIDGYLNYVHFTNDFDIVYLQNGIFSISHLDDYIDDNTLKFKFELLYNSNNSEFILKSLSVSN